MAGWDDHRAPVQHGLDRMDRDLIEVNASLDALHRRSAEIGRRAKDAAAVRAASRQLGMAVDALPFGVDTRPAGASPEPVAGSDGRRWGHHPVTIGGTLTFEVTIDPDAADPVSVELASGFVYGENQVGLVLRLLGPGGTLVDLGAHLGAFALSAAASGARVLAVEAAADNVAALRISADRNGFHQLLVVHAAASDQAGTLEFLPQGPWGQVVRAPGPGTVSVPAVTVDELVAELGWSRVSVVKIDVEGAELSTLRGMRKLLTGADAPPVVYESNGFTLPLHGVRPRDLIEFLEAFGYTSYRIGDGRLVRVRPTDIQPETVIDYLAVKRVPPVLLADGWQVEPEMAFGERVELVLAECRHPVPQHRSYILDALRDAEPALLRHPEIAEAIRVLEMRSGHAGSNRVRATQAGPRLGARAE